MAASPCPVCGTVNRPGARFCGRCKTALTNAPQSPPAPPNQPPKPAAPPAQTQATPPPTPPAQPTQPVAPPTPPTPQTLCPNCGKPNRAAAKRCAHCGKPMATMQVPPPAPMPRPIAPQPVPQAPAQPAPMPPAPKRGNAAVMPIVLLICLIVALCASLSGIFVVENNQPTATATLDLASGAPTATFTPPPSPTAAPIAANTPTATPNPPFPVVSMKITSDGRFGLMTTIGDPNNPKDDNKPLTFRPEKSTDLPNGSTNNTRISIDGKTPLYGGKDGTFIQPPKLTDSDSRMSAVWQFEKIVITQTVDVVLSASTHRLDTFKITYTAENRDTLTHTVGARLMIDTLIGSNDGVPFVVPGRTGLITTPLDLRAGEIPNFVQVYENADLANPGVTLQLTLTGGDATPPDRFVIAPWCNENAGWDFFAEEGGMANHTLHQCGDLGKGAKDDKLDSAVGIFFDPKLLRAGETREWTTFYGLGAVKKETAASALSLAKPPDRVRVGEEFWIVALVQNPQAGQKVKLSLPPELQLTQNPVEQTITPGAPLTQVSWRVRAVGIGNAVTLVVELTPGAQKESVPISVVAPPTPTLAPTPKPCATSITKPTCP